MAGMAATDSPLTPSPEARAEAGLTPDLCIVGAGAGGLSLAAAAAALGVSVVLVEKGAMGGDCLNHGCVPSKALLAAAAAAQAMRSGARFGVAPGEPSVDFAQVKAHVAATRAAIAPQDSAERFRALGVKVIRAAGRFVSSGAFEAGGTRILARRFVLATGSRPVIPPIPGIELVRPLTNETIFDLPALPARLVVIGAGPIGLELAQAFRRLGSETIVIDAGPALGREDRELVAPLLTALRREGVVIHENTQIAAIEPVGEGARLLLADGRRIEAPHLLVAAGRVPVTEGLGLDAAGVAVDERGIRVGPDLRTSNRKVYAIGDAAGGPQFTHAAGWHAGLVLRSALFRLRIEARPERVPRVVYADPELTWIGLGEDEARARHKAIRVLRSAFADNDRARAEAATNGHVKLIVAGGRIVGGGAVGAGAGDLAPLLTMAVERRMRPRDIAELAIPYPTRAEAVKRAAASDLARLAGAPALRALIGFLRRFG